MPQERLDIVNEHDDVIGQEYRHKFWKSEARKQGGRLRYVHIFLNNAQGEILIQQRSTTKSAYPNLLDLSAAGHVIAGDTYEQSAYREMQEEIGLSEKTTPLTPLFRRTVEDRGFSWLYEGHVPNATPLTLDPEEVRQALWYDPDKIQYLFAHHPYLFSGGLQGSWPQFYHYLTTGEKPV